MDLYSAGGEFPLQLDLPLSDRQLARHRRRCARVAKLLLAAGALGVLALCLIGLRPAAVSIPLFFGTSSLLLGAASAALFANVARFELSARGGRGEDDGGWPGGGWDDPGDVPGGGPPSVDWERFERDFRAHCERAGSPQA